MSKPKRPKDSPFAARDTCINRDNHTPHPKGFLAQAEWAERMNKTHTQERCIACGYFEIWVPK